MLTSILQLQSEKNWWLGENTHFINPMLLFGGTILLVKWFQTSKAADRLPLTPEMISEFIERGIIVVPGVLSDEEIAETRQKYHSFLREHGVRDFYNSA